MATLEITKREVFNRIDMADRSQIRHADGRLAAYALLALALAVPLFFVAVNAIGA